MNKRIFTLKELVFIAVAAALTAVCSWITVPTTVPFTLQVFAVFFALEFIGGKNGTVAFFVYTALGAVGVPVFSGMRGGIGHLFGPTGGYLFGLALSCVIFWMSEKMLRSKMIVHFSVLLCSLAACYICGTVWFVLSTGRTVGEALMLCVVPFILPDVVKIALAYILAVRLKKAVKI